MTDYFGLPVGSLHNQHLRLDYLLEGGLRVIRLVPTGGFNLLAETPDFGWETPFGWYHLRGGHRLWRAPQHSLYTSIPENQPVQVEEFDRGVRLVQPADAHSGICKSIEIQLADDRPAVVLNHRLTNESSAPVELSAWGVTQVPLGGRIILPQADAPQDMENSGPNRNLVFWPYTNLPDDRLEIQNRYLLFDAQPAAHEFKLGTYNPHGWIGYCVGSCFFCKRFFPQAGQTYPDMGSNVEIYCNHHFAEIETLSPLRRLEAGDSIEHTEIWEIFTLDEARALMGIEDTCFLPRG
jgi:hypothetical protein